MRYTKMFDIYFMFVISSLSLELTHTIQVYMSWSPRPDKRNTWKLMLALFDFFRLIEIQKVFHCFLLQPFYPAGDRKIFHWFQSFCSSVCSTVPLHRHPSVLHACFRTIINIIIIIAIIFFAHTCAAHIWHRVLSIVITLAI